MDVSKETELLLCLFFSGFLKCSAGRYALGCPSCCFGTLVQTAPDNGTAQQRGEPTGEPGPLLHGYRIRSWRNTKGNSNITEESPFLLKTPSPVPRRAAALTEGREGP